MNKQIKSLFAIVIIIFSIFLSGCNNQNSIATTETSSTGENASETETPSLSDYYYGGEVYIQCSDEELNRVAENAEIIIQALNNRDADKIKSVMSKVAIQEMEHPDEEIQYVFDMFDGAIIKSEKYRWKSVSKDVYGEERRVIQLDYNIYTDEKTYFLEMLYLPENDTEFDNIGIYSFVLGDFERESLYYRRGLPVLRLIPGIISLDTESVEYNKNILADLYIQYWNDGILAENDALMIASAGIERIEDIQAELDEFNGLDITVTDALGDKYYMAVLEYGGIL